MTRPEIATFLQNEPLFHAAPSLEMMDEGFLNEPRGSLYYGTGLTTPRAPSVGLPFDVLIFILVAEKLRRRMGLDRIYHHIADTHALTNDFCTSEGVATVAAEYRSIMSRIAEITKIPLTVRLSSEFDTTADYRAMLATVHTDKSEYVQRELTDMLWYRKTCGVSLKLGWLIQATETALGFDERLYDREFRTQCDARMSFAYVAAGRTLDPKRMKVSPYISVADEHRILLKPNEDVLAKVQATLPEWRGDKTLGGLTRHLNNIVRLWDKTTGEQTAPGQDIFVRVQALINRIFA
ncbi:MAG: hypothetical protein Q7R83_03200 [bacterium]|nr:hypothetical protein [bacterium]